jgi:hypothetical protein
MDAETEQQGIEPEIAEYPEAGPYWVGLWALARHWVALLESIFEPDLIATTGITRSFALRCCKWLWSIEGLIRRLIIAAAMKLPAKRDAAQLAGLTTGKHKPSQPRRPASASFIVLPRSPGKQPRSPNTRPPATLPEHRHLAFPGDDLLLLFARPGRSHARPACRRSLNPLHRRGRRSPWDPDYQDDPEKSEEASRRYWLYGPDAARLGEPLPSVLDREPRLRTRADRSSPYWKPRGDGPEWKRIEQEWARIIPAPGLAGRIKALVRVMQAPERWVMRTARRLNAERDLASKIRTTPPPAYRRPKLDRGAGPPLEAPLAEAHALFDTS